VDELKIEEYKHKLELYTKEKTDIEKQLILIEDQYKQQQQKIKDAFGTIDPIKLQKISDECQIQITQLEKELNAIESSSNDL